MKDYIILLIVILTILSLIFYLTKVVYAPIIHKTPPQPSETKIKQIFNTIHNQDYDLHYDNCSTKSERFAQYLINDGAIDVYIVQIMKKDSNKGHEAVIWYDDVYDPTMGIWKMDQTEYFDLMKSYGLDGYKYIYSFD